MSQTNEEWWGDAIQRPEDWVGDWWIDPDDMEAIVVEAERRGYERAMEEVREAILTTTDSLLSPGTETEENFQVVVIPKSFFEK